MRREPGHLLDRKTFRLPNVKNTYKNSWMCYVEKLRKLFSSTTLVGLFRLSLNGVNRKIEMRLLLSSRVIIVTSFRTSIQRLLEALSISNSEIDKFPSSLSQNSSVFAPPTELLFFKNFSQMFSGSSFTGKRPLYLPMPSNYMPMHTNGHFFYVISTEKKPFSLV